MACSIPIPFRVRISQLQDHRCHRLEKTKQKENMMRFENSIGFRFVSLSLIFSLENKKELLFTLKLNLFT